jgi:hypothetical protein
MRIWLMRLLAGKDARALADQLLQDAKTALLRDATEAAARDDS